MLRRSGEHFLGRRICMGHFWSWCVYRCVGLELLMRAGNSLSHCRPSPLRSLNNWNRERGCSKAVASLRLSSVHSGLNTQIVDKSLGNLTKSSKWNVDRSLASHAGTFLMTSVNMLSGLR